MIGKVNLSKSQSSVKEGLKGDIYEFFSKGRINIFDDKMLHTQHAEDDDR